MNEITDILKVPKPKRIFYCHGKFGYMTPELRDFLKHPSQNKARKGKTS